MVSKVREAVREAGASLLGALVASTILTASIALPLGVRAVDASRGPAGLDDRIALDDVRFPTAVTLGSDQAEILASRGRQETDRLDAEVAGATVTSTTPLPLPPAETDEPGADEELAIAIPTPTTVPDQPPAPTPTPPAVTATPSPTDPAPPEESTADPEPTPTSPEDPAPTPEPDADTGDEPSEPAEESLDGPSTDVYAFVSGAPLRANEMSSLEIKTVNRGRERTTGVAVAVTAAGGSIVSMAPGSADWTCTGTDDAWRCTGPTLEAASFSRSLMTVLPEDDELSLSVSVSHELFDEEPANDTFSAALPVEGGGPDPADPPVDPAPPTDPADPADPPVVPAPPTDPADPADPPVEPGAGGTGGTTDPPPETTPPADPADPADPGAGGTSGPAEPAEPGPPDGGDQDDAGAGLPAGQGSTPANASTDTTPD